MKQDEYGTVVNHPETYSEITSILRTHGSIIFAWTDEQSTHLDILMAYRPRQFGSLQRGMSTITDLFIAVSGFGMFGFELNGIEKHSSYIGEKLNLGGSNTTTDKLADLVNGICRGLEKQSDEK